MFNETPAPHVPLLIEVATAFLRKNLPHEFRKNVRTVPKFKWVRNAWATDKGRIHIRVFIHYIEGILRCMHTNVCDDWTDSSCSQQTTNQFSPLFFIVACNTFSIYLYTDICRQTISMQQVLSNVWYVLNIFIHISSHLYMNKTYGSKFGWMAYAHNGNNHARYLRPLNSDSSSSVVVCCTTVRLHECVSARVRACRETTIHHPSTSHTQKTALIPYHTWANNTSRTVPCHTCEYYMSSAAHQSVYSYLVPFTQSTNTHADWTRASSTHTCMHVPRWMSPLHHHHIGMPFVCIAAVCHITTFQFEPTNLTNIIFHLGYSTNKCVYVCPPVLGESCCRCSCCCCQRCRCHRHCCCCCSGSTECQFSC